MNDIQKLIKLATDYALNGEPELAMVVYDEWSYEHPELALLINREDFELTVYNN